jgi:hypothetical protein
MGSFANRQVQIFKTCDLLQVGVEHGFQEMNVNGAGTKRIADERFSHSIADRPFGMEVNSATGKLPAFLKKEAA